MTDISTLDDKGSKNRFKNTNGQHYLLALFFETATDSERANVVYTLKLEDHNGLPSLHRLYIECDDPTEYTFAKKYFDGWAHWKKLIACSWFKPYLEAMREELEIKMKADALNNIRYKAMENGKDGVTANKYLIEKGYVDKNDTRGRPSKETIKREADKLFKDKEDVIQDWNRLNG